MTESISDEIQFQRDYYSKTAAKYDDMHVDSNEKDEHFFALTFMIAALNFFEIQSILDIGSGTGRAIQYIKKEKPELRIMGIEPIYYTQVSMHRWI